jgi:hypothetical protein
MSSPRPESTTGMSVREAGKKAATPAPRQRQRQEPRLWREATPIQRAKMRRSIGALWARLLCDGDYTVFAKYVFER